MNATNGLIAIAVQNSRSYTEVARFLGFSVGGAALKRLRRQIEELGFDCSHFSAKRNSKKMSLDEILCKRNQRLSKRHKDEILKEGLLEEECSSCGLGPEWNGEPITLQVDHINGDAYDHRYDTPNRESAK